MEDTSTSGRLNDMPIGQYNEICYKQDVKLYAHRPWELVQVDKERIEDIRIAVNEAKANVGKGEISCNVLLGLSTTFFGAFIGVIPNIFNMITEQEIEVYILFYFALLLVGLILFFIYLHKKHDQRVSGTILIEKISHEIERISNNIINLDVDSLECVTDEIVTKKE